MKFELPFAAVLTALIAFSAWADEPEPAAPSAAPPPSEEKISYALGMNLGLQIKHIGADVDVDVIAKAVKDVLDGKPTQLQEAEMRPIFMQSQAYELARKSEKNRAEGEAFLAKNAKVPGTMVLPDGVQYRVLKEGAGEMPVATNFINFNYRGSWVNGAEFVRREHVQVPLNLCPKGMGETLKLMKVGSKLQIFVPSEVAYGHYPGRSGGFGSTLIYDLELISSEPPSQALMEQYGGGRLGHSPDEDFLPPANATPGVANETVSETANQPRPRVILPGAPGK